MCRCVCVFVCWVGGWVGGCKGQGPLLKCCFSTTGLVHVSPTLRPRASSPLPPWMESLPAPPEILSLPSPPCSESCSRNRPGTEGGKGGGLRGFELHRVQACRQRRFSGGGWRTPTRRGVCVCAQRSAVVSASRYALLHTHRHPPARGGGGAQSVRLTLPSPPTMVSSPGPPFTSSSPVGPAPP